MVYVAAGPFFRGSDDSEHANSDEVPVRSASIDAFWIDVTEVTAGDFASCVRAGACAPEGVLGEQLGVHESSRSEFCNYGRRPEHPMNCIDWGQAAAYCAWRGLRLPTEAEWEKASRGTSDARQFAWGDEVPSGATGLLANLADEAARREQPTWSAFDGYDDGYLATAPVGSFPSDRSALGIVDATGNVAEWTASWYRADSRADDAAVAASARTFRVVRGASWDAAPVTVRLSRRAGYLPSDRSHSLGFRCAF